MKFLLKTTKVTILVLLTIISSSFSMITSSSSLFLNPIVLIYLSIHHLSMKKFFLDNTEYTVYMQRYTVYKNDILNRYLEKFGILCYLQYS